MVNLILVFVAVFLLIILLEATILFVLNKIFKVQNVTWLKSLLIVFVVLIVYGVLSSVLDIFLPKILSTVVTLVPTYFIFKRFIKKSDNLLSKGKTLLLFCVLLVIGTTTVYSLVYSFRLKVAEPFLVSGSGMSPTYIDKDYLISNKINKNYIRGDVVAFKVPPTGLTLANYSLDKELFYIKRIVGLPGETVEINGAIVKISNQENPNGIIINEPYAFVDKLSPYYKNVENMKMSVTLKNDEYFVIGDNRCNSSDSRFWGPLKKENINGVITLKAFNLGLK